MRGHHPLIGGAKMTITVGSIELPRLSYMGVIIWLNPVDKFLLVKVA